MAAAAKSNKRSLRSVAIAPCEEPRRIEFSSNGVSNLAGLLSLATKLPTIRYDVKNVRHVIDVDAEQKQTLLGEVHEGVHSLVDALRLVGVLLAGHDETVGLLEESERADVGFLINGLADLAAQLMQAQQEIEDAEPIREVRAVA
jgi:hypothetical protein